MDREGTQVLGLHHRSKTLVQFALANELKIVNTLHQTHIGKLATYRIDKTIVNRNNEIIANKIHAQINYILAERRWRNSVSDTESDTRANINSDHFTLIFTTSIKLKAMPKG